LFPLPGEPVSKNNFGHLLPGPGSQPNYPTFQ
jgi:hypothetical protein